MSRIESILDAEAGEVVVRGVDLLVLDDFESVFAIQAFEDLGMDVFDRERVLFVLDHCQGSCEDRRARAREFAEEWRIRLFEEGIAHHLLSEQGYVLENMIIAGNDSHTCTHCALCALGVGFGPTEIGALLSTGRTWFQVPRTQRYSLVGEPGGNVTAKDVALFLGSEVDARGDCIELCGDFSTASRMTISNFAPELGAECILFSDEKGEELDISGLEAMVACPHDPRNVRPVSEMGEVELDKVVIGLCSNGSFEDLESACRILQGKKVQVETMIVPATRNVLNRLRATGLVEVLERSGAVVKQPGCGPCFGRNYGQLEKGEVCLTTGNRNYRGRMGSPEAEIYLASPVTAAASALTGRIEAAG